jgi:hypothetical protein
MKEGIEGDVDSVYMEEPYGYSRGSFLGIRIILIKQTNMYVRC